MLFMKMAKAREARKDNKGFSLVELIIVIAIMVALVAMLAPQFVKYVQKSRDAVVSSAAEDVLATAKSEFALTHLTFSGTGDGVITISVVDKHLNVALTSGLNFDSSSTTGAGCTFAEQCGIDTQKTTQSTLKYVINIKNNAGSPTFEMALDSSASTGG